MIKISKAMSIYAHDWGNGTDTVSLGNEYINRLLLLACRLNNISPKQLEPFIPSQKGMRNTFAFKCLLNIYVYPRQTKSRYAKHFHTCQEATAEAIEYLAALGLIQAIGRPRLIIPLQTYKVDTAYKVTIKGSTVLQRVVDLIEVK